MNPTKYIIVNARGTDGYTIVREYADGSQDSGSGWYGDIESAYNNAAENREENSSAKIINGTDVDEDDLREYFGIVFDA